MIEVRAVRILSNQASDILAPVYTKSLTEIISDCQKIGKLLSRTDDVSNK